MKCLRCGTQLVDDARFCGICGYSLSASTPAGPLAKAFPDPLVNNDATMMAPWRPNTQPMPGGQQAASLGSAPTVSHTPSPAQPGAFQPTQQGSGPQQPPAGWQPIYQSQANYPPAMMPGTLNSSGIAAPVKKRKRRGGGFLRTLLFLVLLLAIFTGAWFLGVRPYLHGIVQAQLDQALGDAESQLLPLSLALPGGQPVAIDENAMNNYLSLHENGQLQHLRATVTPAHVRIDFEVYGQPGAITFVPIASAGLIQVTNVQVEGLLGLVMSPDELTAALNSNFQQFGEQMHRTVEHVTLREHIMEVRLA